MERVQKILITGAAGFVGTALCRELHLQGYPLRALVRRGGSCLPEDLIHDLDDVVEINGFLDVDSWCELLDGVDQVVHLAARVHIGKQLSATDLYFQDNLDLTVVLAQAVLKSQVKKFIFVSTIKVNGEGTLKADHNPYKISDRSHPEGAYAVSKWRAEQELYLLFNHSRAQELVILRPPMIYGNAAKGNCAFLKKWLQWGFPVPVPRNGNSRSLLALKSFIDLLAEILAEPVGPENRLLLPCDKDDWSTEHLANYLAQKSGCRVRTLAIPTIWVSLMAFLLKKEDFCIKLFGSLRIEKE